VGSEANTTFSLNSRCNRFKWFPSISFFLVNLFNLTHFSKSINSLETWLHLVVPWTIHWETALRSGSCGGPVCSLQRWHLTWSWFAWIKRNLEFSESMTICRWNAPVVEWRWFIKMWKGVLTCLLLSGPAVVCFGGLSSSHARPAPLIGTCSHRPAAVIYGPSERNAFDQQLALLCLFIFK